MTRHSGIVTHLRVVTEVTHRSYGIALLALTEALGEKEVQGRIDQLRRIADDLKREVRRLEAASLELADDADFDPAAILHRERQEELAELRAVRLGNRRSEESYDRSLGKPRRTARGYPGNED